MTSLASQLILHPTVSQTLALGSTTVGRDKTYRAVQYLSRFLAWFFLKKGETNVAARWDILKSHLALARKLLRLGKFVEHLQAALRAAQAVGDAGEQITTIGRQLSYSAYLAYDAVLWANSVKLIMLSPWTAQTINKYSNRFWFSGILFSVTHSLLKAGRLADEVKSLHSSRHGEKSIGDEAGREAKLRALKSARAVTRLQFIADILDIWIPATNLGLVSFNDGVLGIFGFITSAMALHQQWRLVGPK